MKDSKKKDTDRMHYRVLNYDDESHVQFHSVSSSSLSYRNLSFREL